MMYLTPDSLKFFSTLTPALLDAIALNSGYVEKFKSAEFLGMTKNAEFCYKIGYVSTETGEIEYGNVYVKYDEEADIAFLDY